MAFFLVSLLAAELNARPPFCLCATHARALQIVCAKLDVRAKLFLHVFGDSPAMKQFAAEMIGDRQ